MSFTYQDFTNRNIGFVTEVEQKRIKDACVFVCGTGGMGGGALMALARAGVGHLIIADIDSFEVSNMNRQIFANMDTVGQDKARATAQQLKKINPTLQVDVFDESWTEHVESCVARADVVVNGTDDLGASLLLYRTARAKSRPVIDAYASPLPSVYTTRPDEAMPEERLGYPTLNKKWNEITQTDRDASFQAEAIHIIIHSSSRHYIDLDAAGEVAAGTRSRMSFAPMVITTGMLMAYETVGILIDKKTGTDNRGWFFNPYKPAVERPRPAFMAAILRPFVTRFLVKMMNQAG